MVSILSAVAGNIFSWALEVGGWRFESIEKGFNCCYGEWKRELNRDR